MKRIKILLTIFLFGFVVFNSFTQEDGIVTRIDSVVATVDGEAITLLDILLESGGDEQLVSMMYADKKQQHDQIRATRKRVLGEIVDRKLVWKAYQKEKYPIPDELIESTLDKMAGAMANGSREGLERKLKRMGVTMPQIREKARQRVACDLMIYEFCFRRISSTPRNQLIFYKANQDSFRVSDEYELAIMILFDKTDTSIRTIQTMLERDSSLFSNLSKVYSEGPNAENGGYLGTLKVDEIPYNIQEFVVNSDHKKGVFGPYTLDDATYFVHLISSKKGRLKPFKEVREEIKEMIERPLKERQLEEFLRNLRNMAIIKDYTEE